MASLLTNASAMTALQTLKSVAQRLSGTQDRISTGLRINSASDNAAYWSIATTLRSDVGALGAVEDALGLGKTTVDTAYTGLDNTKDLLGQIKDKLVTASQPGVPRAQVQAEISELLNRLRSGADSTVINGQSWLTQDSTAADYNPVRSVVGSFTRVDGTVSIDTIDIDVSAIKLYEMGGPRGSEEVGPASTLPAEDNEPPAAIADVLNATDAEWANTLRDVLVGVPGSSILDVLFTGTGVEILTPAISPGYDAHLSHDSIFSLIEPDISNGTFPATNAQILQYIGGNISNITSTKLNNALRLISDRLSAGGSQYINFIADEKGAFLSDLNQEIAKYKTAVSIPKWISSNYSFIENLQEFRFGEFIDNIQDTLEEYLGDTRREEFLAEYLIAHPPSPAPAPDPDPDVEPTPLPEAGILDKVRSTVTSQDGTKSREISVADMDISALTDTDFDRDVMTAYVQAVDDALGEVTLAASTLGAAKTRIEGNQTFVKALIDANNRGIGQLVDADLSEESARLKALQTQQQLAIQSLSIANTAPDVTLQLFR